MQTDYTILAEIDYRANRNRNDTGRRQRRTRVPFGRRSAKHSAATR